MNIYLKNYCRFLFNCKVVSISDTQKYISNNEFDINEILSYFQECININDIFNLVHSNKFYKGHNLKEKYSLLTQFFSVIHNYSKNLILKYDVYSTKSIKKTTSNIKDCLIYIPHYENYLSDLLGYIYDEEKSEWYIDSAMLNSNLLLAATCILCGYAHEKLTKIMNETNFTENDDGFESKNSTLSNKEKYWICKSCSFSNDFKSVNCELCFHSREVKLKESNKQPLTKKLKKNQWECNECTFINEITNNFCDACNSNKRLSYSLPVSFLNDSQNKKQQNVVVSENISETITRDQNKVNTRKRRPSFEVNSMERQSLNGWICNKCTFLNNEKNLNCETCSSKREVKITDKRKKISKEIQINESRNSSYKMKRSESEHVLIHRNPDKWSCQKCTFLNKIENLYCETCSTKREVKITDKRKNIYPEIHTNESRNSANKMKRSESEHVLIHRNPNKWSCQKCTFLNKIENLNCETCSTKREVRTNFINKTYPQKSYPSSSSDRKFINKKENSKENYPKEPGVKIDDEFKNEPSKHSHIPPKSTGLQEKIGNNNNKNNKHKPSDKQKIQIQPSFTSHIQNYPKEPGVKIDDECKNEPSEFPHNPRKSAGPEKFGNNDNKNPHKPSNQQGSNTGKNIQISSKNENRQLISEKNEPNKKTCKICKKEKHKKKHHRMCRIRNLLCIR